MKIQTLINYNISLMQYNIRILSWISVGGGVGGWGCEGVDMDVDVGEDEGNNWVYYSHSHPPDI